MNLKQQLKQAGLSQVALAKLGDFTTQSVNNWCQGRQPVPKYVTELVSMFEALNTKDKSEPTYADNITVDLYRALSGMLTYYGMNLDRTDYVQKKHHEDAEKACNAFTDNFRRTDLPPQAEPVNSELERKQLIKILSNAESDIQAVKAMLATVALPQPQDAWQDSGLTYNNDKPVLAGDFIEFTIENLPTLGTMKGEVYYNKEQAAFKIRSDSGYGDYFLGDSWMRKKLPKPPINNKEGE